MSIDIGDGSDFWLALIVAAALVALTLLLIFAPARLG